MNVIITEKQEMTAFKVKYALIKTNSFIGPCWEIVGEPTESASEAYNKLRSSNNPEDYVITPIYVIP